MNGVKNIVGIEETGPLVHLDMKNLPDLDALMLDVYAWAVAEDMEMPYEDRYSYEWEGKLREYGGDRRTRIPDGGYSTGEAVVGYFRKNPCVCGEDHAFDMDEVPTDEDGKPVGSGARGAFLGVYFR